MQITTIIERPKHGHIWRPLVACMGFEPMCEGSDQLGSHNSPMEFKILLEGRLGWKFCSYRSVSVISEILFEKIQQTDWFWTWTNWALIDPDPKQTHFHYGSQWVYFQPMKVLSRKGKPCRNHRWKHLDRSRNAILDKIFLFGVIFYSKLMYLLFSNNNHRRISKSV